MIARMLIQNTIWLFGLGALLFGSAGTLRWLNGWLFMLVLIISSYVLGIWLAKSDPVLLKERLRFPIQREQKKWDKIFVCSLMIVFIVWFYIMGMDARRYQYSHVPLLLQMIGFIGIVLSLYISYLTFKENTFAAPTIKIQKNQKVITTGPYSVVRHPLYAGFLFFLFGTPLFLSSWLGLAWALIMVFLIAIRAVLEENTLKDELEGYKAYMTKVKYRFIPYIW